MRYLTFAINLPTLLRFWESSSPTVGAANFSTTLTHLLRHFGRQSAHGVAYLTLVFLTWLEVCRYVTNTWICLKNGMPLNPLVNVQFAIQNWHFGVSSVFGQAHIQWHTNTEILFSLKPKCLQHLAVKMPMSHIHPISIPYSGSPQSVLDIPRRPKSTHFFQDTAVASGTSRVRWKSWGPGHPVAFRPNHWNKNSVSWLLHASTKWPAQKMNQVPGGYCNWLSALTSIALQLYIDIP